MKMNAPFAFYKSTGATRRLSPDKQREGASARFMAGGAILFALIGAAGLQPAVIGAPFISLDQLAKQPAPAPNPIEDSQQTFTGSAFFFAADAFTASPQAPAKIDSSHVWALQKVDAAPSAALIGITAQDRYRALNCLTSAIYYEAGNEPVEGQRAVAQVVLNRVHHPAWPNSVCGVVYQGSERTDMLCQFTFSCDGAMARLPVAGKWARARRVAEIALAGNSYAPVGLATYYHTLAVRPRWSSQLNSVAVVGAHIFYQMRGINGTAAAFRVPYMGRELISGPAPRVWKPLPAGEMPVAMPYTPVADMSQYQPSASLPGGQQTTPALAAPSSSQEWKAPAQSIQPELPGQSLPQSTIRPEYRDSGKPLI